MNDSQLHVPDAVAAAMRALRPETRARLSLRDIDDMTRPLRDEIARLRRELDEARAEVARLRAALKAVDDWDLRCADGLDSNVERIKAMARKALREAT